uniref:Uncharacterized protein n=1 Tax=Sphaerodactylus townsendi TaxID=933632 RepID=A0ACB8FQR1_9SAUR
MQRREDLAAGRLGRAPAVGRLGRTPGAAAASAGLPSAQAGGMPRRPGRGGGARGPQPPPLLPPSATGSGAPAPTSAPTPLMPGATVKAEPENKYLPELMAEKDSLDPSFTHAMQLLQAGNFVAAVGPAVGRGGDPNEAFCWALEHTAPLSSRVGNGYTCLFCRRL